MENINTDVGCKKFCHFLDSSQEGGGRGSICSFPGHLLITHWRRKHGIRAVYPISISKPKSIESSLMVPNCCLELCSQIY